MNRGVLPLLLDQYHSRSSSLQGKALLENFGALGVLPSSLGQLAPQAGVAAAAADAAESFILSRLDACNGTFS